MPSGLLTSALRNVVTVGHESVSVSSWGIEHDGIFESDEGAQGDQGLFLPSGRDGETVTNKAFGMDCPTSTVGDDFHYGARREMVGRLRAVGRKCRS